MKTQALAVRWVRRTHWLMMSMVTLLSSWSVFVHAQNGTGCYLPLTTPNATAVPVQDGVISLSLTSFSPLASITDYNPDSYATNTTLLDVTTANGVAVLSNLTYPAGTRAGFVVEVTGGLLSADVLSSIKIQTKLNGTLVDDKSTANGISVTLLGGTSSGKLYLNFPSSGSFNQVFFFLNNVAALNLAANTLRIYNAMAFDPNCGQTDADVCEDQIAGTSTVVNFNAGLVGALGTLSNKQLLNDGDKTTYAELGLPVGTGLLSTPIYVGVTDFANVYPAGNKAGFVIGWDATLLTADVLSNIKIQTYLFGELVDEASFNDGAGAINISALSVGGDNKQKIELTSIGKFNEVRLVFNSTVSAALSSVKLYYAYESGPSCTYCQVNVTNTPVASPWTRTLGICIGGGLSNENNVVSADPDDYASIAVLLGVGCGGIITLPLSSTAQAGTFAGFEVSGDASGLLGLLSLSLLDNITVEAYNNTTLIGSASGAALLEAGILAGPSGRTIIGFKPTGSFNRISITIQNVISVASTYRIYRGFTITDTDGDGVPDCIDQCASGNDLLDTDGDGIPDCADACNLGAAPPMIFASNVAADCNTLKADLSTIPAWNIPSGATITYHTATPATDLNKVSDATVVGPGTYYAAFYSSTQTCYSTSMALAVTAVCPPKPEPEHIGTYKEHAVNGHLNTNDLDPMSLSLTYNTTPATVPAHGTVSIATNGSYTYTPATDYIGVDSFRYEVCNTSAMCSSEWVYVSVLPIPISGGMNNAPVAINTHTQTKMDMPVSGNLNMNASDPDEDALVFTTERTTSHGVLLLNNDGTYTYTPGNGYVGTDTAWYQVCDDVLPTPGCTISMLVIDVIPDYNGASNNPPFAQDEVLVAQANSAETSGNLKSNDLDPNGDALSIYPVGIMPDGLVVNSDGTYTYTPPAGWYGTLEVVYEVRDGNGGSDFATLSIVVLPPPIILPMNGIALTVGNSLQSNTIRWQLTDDKAWREFEVERAADNAVDNNFASIAKVLATAGTTAYSYVDREKTAQAVTMYRIKAVTNTGNVHYSAMVTVRKAASQKVQMWPNPVLQQFNLQLNSSDFTVMQLRISSIAGKQLMQQQLNVTPGTTSFNIQLPQGMAAGYFLVEITAGKEQVLMAKMLKL